jgi:DNA-binding NarL/FixJ family response regulator
MAYRPPNMTTLNRDNVLVRIVLADDHGLVRAGLRQVLDGIGHVEVVGEAKDGTLAVQVVENLSPNIALLDISMPGMSGLASLKAIRASRPATKVVLLSMYDNLEYVTEAIRAGAVGYLVKDGAEDELAGAIQAVMRGDVYLSPRISRQLAGAFVKRADEVETAALTARQTEVLRLIAMGHSSKGAARELDLSVKTIETYRAQIMERLDIRDVAGLVRYAIRIGLVSQDA